VRVVLVAVFLAGMATAARAQMIGECTPGRLANAWRLPDQGQGWLVPETWRQRGRSFGTASMVGLIRKVAEHVQRTHPGSTLYVGDLSLPRGGKTRRHRTHREGRDADLLFYATRYDGLPAPPPSQMIRYDAYGRSRDGTLHFDQDRNWELLKVLVDDPRVERVFVAAWIEQLLLDWGRARGASPQLLARAAALMTNPRHVSPHDDHFHVRVGCERVPRYVASESPAPTYPTYPTPSPTYAPPPPAPAPQAVPPPPEARSVPLDRLHPMNRVHSRRR